MKHRLSALLLLALALAFAAAPFLVTNFRGMDPALYPIPQVDPPVQPAGWAFAIWGLIYLALIAHGLAALLVHADDPLWLRARPWLCGSLALGVPWLWIAENSALWSTLVIVAMAGLAVAALARMPVGPGRWLRITPVALYAGWLSAAAPVAVAFLGAGYGIVLGETGWAVLVILAASVMAGGIQMTLARAPEYGAMVLWALVAILIRNMGQNQAVTIAASVGMLIVFGAVARVLRQRGRGI